MALPGFKLKVTLTKIPLWKVGAIDQARGSAARLFHFNIAPKLEFAARKFTPIGASSELFNSIKAQKVTSVLTPWDIEVGWHAGYAEPVADGSRPHFAPLMRIAEWATAKLGNPALAQAVRDSIAIRGTQPNPYQKKTQEAVKSVVRTDIIGAINFFVRKLTQ